MPLHVDKHTHTHVPVLPGGSVTKETVISIKTVRKTSTVGDKEVKVPPPREPLAVKLSVTAVAKHKKQKAE